MNSSKNSFCENQLNSNTTLFLQLGIILALIIVYSFFELEFSKNISQLPSQTGYEDDLTFIIPNFKLKKEIPEKEIKKKKPLDLRKISIDDAQKDDAQKVETLLLGPPTNDINTSLSKIIEVNTEEDDEPMPINIVEQAPRYPGCKGKTELEFKKCLNKKIKTFVSNKFNSSLTIRNNIYGKQKIYVQFEIDKNGHIVNITVRSLHKKLEKEAIRVIGKLPKMIPGKQHNKNVSVKYNLPISFYIK